MALTSKFSDWLEKTIIRLGCKWYGHTGFKTLEVYSDTIRIKDFRMFNGKFYRVDHYEEHHIKGKHQCTRCNAIFIGNIVKDKPIHNNQYEGQ